MWRRVGWGASAGAGARAAEQRRARRAAGGGALLEAGGVHQLLVLVGAEGGKDVGEARGEKGDD